MNTTHITPHQVEPKTATKFSLNELYQAWQHLSPNEIIIDIRSPADYAEMHIPGSRNIPYASVIEQQKELRKYSRACFYCYGGQGSEDIATRLAEMGVTNTCYLGNAGMADWQAAGHVVNQN